MANPTWDSTAPANVPARNMASPDAVPTWDETIDPGSFPEQAKAAVEGLVRGATLGTSDKAEQSLGISTKERIAARREANPVTSFASEMIGSIAPVVATEGAAAPLALGAIGKGGYCWWGSWRRKSD